MTDSLLGKYAIFVIPAYVLTIMVFAGLTLLIGRRLRHWSKLAKKREAVKDLQ